LNKVTNAIKDKIVETIWQESPTKPKPKRDSTLDQYIPKYYFATLTDSDGNKRYMTVCNIFVNVLNGTIEQSVIITECDKSLNEDNQLVCSASLCLISDRPIFQFQ